jgi:phosphonate transport system substrate-binding protein
MAESSIGTVPDSVEQDRAVLRLSSCQAPDSEYVMEAVARHLTEHCDLPVVFSADRDWRQRYAELEAGLLDAAWICGAGYLRLLQPGPGLTPLVAPVWRGPRYADRPVYFSDVLARSDSPSRAFEDLRGGRLAVNEPGSWSGHGCVGVELSRRQEAAGFFSSVTVSGSHEASVDLVVAGEVDAAAIDSTVLDERLRREPALASRLRRVGTLGPAPMPPIVASASLPPRHRQRLRAALTQLHTTNLGQELLAGLPVSRFAAVDERDYATMRELLATAVRLVPDADPVPARNLERTVS